jgi:hypothetical protein
MQTMSPPPSIRLFIERPQERLLHHFLDHCIRGGQSSTLFMPTLSIPVS